MGIIGLGFGVVAILEYLSFLWTQRKLISTISVAVPLTSIFAGIAEMKPTIFLELATLYHVSSF